MSVKTGSIWKKKSIPNLSVPLLIPNEAGMETDEEKRRRI